MNTLFHMAWRNLWRNARRTAITAGAVALGLAIMLFTLGYVEGMQQYMLKTVTDSLVGHAQLHAEGWRERRSAGLILPDGAKQIDKAENDPGVLAAAPRTRADGLLAMGDRSALVGVIGVDINREPNVTDWKERLIEGRYPEDPNEALVGRKLAEKLEIEAGGKLVLTVADATTGDLNARLLRISGVMFTNNPMLDERAVVVDIAMVQQMLGQPGGIHEIVLRLKGDIREPATVDPILARLSSPGVVAAGWRELAPMTARILRLNDVVLLVVTAIIFFIMETSWGTLCPTVLDITFLRSIMACSVVRTLSKIEEIFRS